MKKIYSQLSNLMKVCLPIVLLLLVSKSAISQDFITEWTFTDDAPMIRFNALSTGEVNYNWTTRPSNLSGEGSFSRIEPGLVTLELDIEEGDTLTLNMAPENLRRFYSVTNDPTEILLNVQQWGEVKWTSMDEMFYSRESVNFTALDMPILTNVNSMIKTFAFAKTFNSNIVDWDVSNVTNMFGMFQGTHRFNQPIGNWDVSNVTNMSEMFLGSISFNQPIGDWDVSNVTKMNDLFSITSNFNQDISLWDVSNVTEMSGIFSVSLFNKPIGNWDVSKVTTMQSMFTLSLFDQDISNWDVSNVTTMSTMFSYSEFNQDISSWNTSNVTNMNIMFTHTTKFNQDLSKWDVSKANILMLMFYDAAAFNQDISTWIYHPEVRLDGILDESGLDCENYSKAISAWKNNPSLVNKTIGAKGLEYGSNKEEDRTYLIEEKGWTFIGDVQSEEECDVTVSTKGNSINDNNIVVYPNPTYRSITIEADPKYLEGLSMLNANGQDVSGLITIQRSGSRANIDLSRLSPGVYVLRTPSNATKVIKM